jgi:hypothetical protein
MSANAPCKENGRSLLHGFLPVFITGARKDIDMQRNPLLTWAGKEVFYGITDSVQ